MDSRKRQPHLVITATAALGLVVASGAASAQDYRVESETRGTVLDVPAQQAAKQPRSLPRRSLTKAAVERRYGSPERRYAAVGEPPITRWDYPDFRVYFEYDLVLHAVIPGDFPTISHRDQLISGNR